VGRRRRAPRSLSEPISSPVGCTLQSKPGASSSPVRASPVLRVRFGWNSMKVFCRAAAKK